VGRSALLCKSGITALEARTWQMRTSALAMLHCSKKKRFICRTDRPSDLREDDPDAITPEERADGLRHDL
jgi:hypothetical protein